MDSDLLKWFIVALVIPSFAALGKWAMNAWEQERTRSERAHEALISTLNTVISNCRDERATALAQMAANSARFTEVLDGSLREHTDSSREIARILDAIKTERR